MSTLPKREDGFDSYCTDLTAALQDFAAGTVACSGMCNTIKIGYASPVINWNPAGAEGISIRFGYNAGLKTNSISDNYQRAPLVVPIRADQRGMWGK